MTMASSIRNARSTIDQPMVWVAAGATAVWLAVTGIAGARGAFLSSPSQPPVLLLLAILTPPLVFAGAYRWSTRWRSFALSIDPRWLIAVQGWRVVGVMFFVLYIYGLLPGLFAYPAGLGDLAVGLSAPFVMLAMAQATPGWRRQVLWLNIAGLTDFFVAVATGALTSTSAIGFFVDPDARASMGELPLSLIPTFAVPLWIVIHALSLLQLARHRRDDSLLG
ncbi:MAG TPA: hypothetical protein VJR58_12135 [Vineibacter sp.]|nr:hypothetical protein [Vineibacter sp.]